MFLRYYYATFYYLSEDQIKNKDETKLPSFTEKLSENFTKINGIVIYLKHY